MGNCRVLGRGIDTAEVRVVLPLTMEGRVALDGTKLGLAESLTVQLRLIGKSALCKSPSEIVQVL